jgi:hypothetical protein
VFLVRRAVFHVARPFPQPSLPPLL